MDAKPSIGSVDSELRKEGRLVLFVPPTFRNGHTGTCLEDFIQYFLENGIMKNLRNKDSANFLNPAKTRAARIAPGPKPVWATMGPS